MTLAAYTLLSIARFGAIVSVELPKQRLWFLDASRVLLVAFGLFLTMAGYLVTYAMFKRLKFLNDTYLFEDEIYKLYHDCIDWDNWTQREKRVVFPNSLYKNIIPLWLPLAEWTLWLCLLVLLWWGISFSYFPHCWKYVSGIVATILAIIAWQDSGHWAFRDKLWAENENKPVPWPFLFLATPRTRILTSLKILLVQIYRALFP